MITPYPFQRDAINAVYSYFKNHNGNPVVVLPTGTGKSIIIGKLCTEILELWPNQRILVLTHVKELIAQNAAKIELLSEVKHDFGIYSAGLKRKEVKNNLIFGGLQSVCKNVEAFGHRDLVFIDEAHLVSPKNEATYMTVINKLKAVNPQLKVVGFTATPYRMKDGLITCNGQLFTDICYDLSSLEEFNKLIADGYLCPLIPKKTKLNFDTSKLHIVAGEYNKKEMDQLFNVTAKTKLAVKEVIDSGHDRKSWLIFASSIDHAESICEMLNILGIPTGVVHSKMGERLRDEAFYKFKSGEHRCLVNKDVATTGFDHPPLDMIAVLRAIRSPGLWVQVLGRATRPSVATDKKNALVLDFGGNTERLGPINDVVIPTKNEAGKNIAGDAPVKLCPKCDAYMHTTATECILCGYIFPKQDPIDEVASDLELIAKEAREKKTYEWIKVIYCIYKKYQRQGQGASLLIIYSCANKQSFTEFVPLDNKSQTNRCKQWLLPRLTVTLPQVPTVDEFLKLKHCAKKPAEIRVNFTGKKPRIVDIRMP